MKIAAFHDFSLASLFTVDLTPRSLLSEYLDDLHCSRSAYFSDPAQSRTDQYSALRYPPALQYNDFTAPQGVKKKHLTIVDLGCGGGDLALWLSGQCSRKGYKAHIIGIDHDPRIAAIALKRCSATRQSLSSIRVRTVSIN